jgi:hypothetical protein
MASMFRKLDERWLYELPNVLAMQKDDMGANLEHSST